ncbi:MAG: exonuclease domain-containing protein [Desulfobacteraceae bacterium]|nr:exonuclease domain-containing protein [Desulfobacteraceae bacterium]
MPFHIMMQTNRFWKFVFLTLIATLMVMAGIIFFLWQKLTTDEIHALSGIAVKDISYITSLVLIFAFVAFIGLQIIYLTYIKPLKTFCAEAELIYSTNPSHRVKITGNRDFKRLATVINDFADMFENLNKTITEQILNARKETEKERNLLAAIMSELPQGVIICNSNGRILLFNSLAKKIFTPGSGQGKSEIFLGLGRSVFHLLDKALIAHALEEIEDRLENPGQNMASSFIAPIHADRLISAEAIPVLDPENRITGFILAFQDVTDEINLYDTTHEKLIALKTDLDIQVQKVREMLNTSGLVPRDTPFLQQELMKAVDLWPRQYEEVSEDLLEAISTRLPLTRHLLKDFLSGVKQKAKYLHDIHLNLSLPDEASHLLADTYSFTAALIFLLQNLSEMIKNHEFNLSMVQKKGFLVFEISWEGPLILRSRIDQLMQKRINSLPSLFYVLRQNKASFEAICDNHEKSSRVRIIARAGSKTQAREKHQAPVITGSRPEFYDLDLFRTDAEDNNLFNTDLKNITYTVFDTETTGLNPDGGDEIISLAAVRIVNNRIVYQDIFEELVDPKRDIPMESYRIHGINYEMVTGKKDIRTIMPAFKDYAAETVLLGHNIAFDMKMFKVKEKQTGISLMNPVLDTLLLSAVLHPVHARHDMESIAERLGVNIIGRHTALGDAIATAEIFLKLIPLLNSNGVLTLRDAVKASKKSYYARLKY